MVSPANKDRPAHREAFVAKCIAYLQQGIGLVVVDIVTERRANLHLDMVRRLGASAPLGWTPDLYATAYRVVDRSGEAMLDIWRETMALGQPLPSVPLWLHHNISIQVHLDATYHQTCQSLRLPLINP